MELDLSRLRDRPFELLLVLGERAQEVLRRRGESSAQGAAVMGLAFRVRQDWFVTLRDEIREILFPVPLTRLPRARPWLLGLANVRGFLVAVTDLGRFLGAEPCEMGSRSRLLWINHPRLPAALLVDEVAGFRRLDRPMSGSSLDSSGFLGDRLMIGGRSYRWLDVGRLADHRSFLEASQ